MVVEIKEEYVLLLQEMHKAGFPMGYKYPWT